MKTVPITCPNCGSADLVVHGNADYQCNHCGSFFHAKPHAGAAPTSVPLARRGRPPPTLAIVMGAVIATMVAGGVGSFVLLKGTSKPIGPPPVVMPPSTTFEAKVADPPRAELGAKIDGTTSIGGRFWLIDYKNTGDTEITNTAVAVSLFDSGGVRVGEQSGYSAIKRIQPGQRVTILVLFSEPPAYQRAEIEIVKPGSGFALAEVPLTISDFRENATYGAMRDIIGTVRNPGLRQVRFVNVIAVGRDSSDQPVSFAQGISTQSEIDAGGQSGFKISVGTFEVEPPKKWEINSVGSPL